MEFKRLKKKGLAIIYLCLVSIPVNGQTKMTPFRNLIIGTYTKSGVSKGIYVYRFNTTTGDFIKKSEIAGVSNPSYLALSKNHHFLYSVNENEKGEVSAFKYNGSSGKIKFLNKVSSGGADPCYISLNKVGSLAIIGNYSSGTLSAIPILQEGTQNGKLKSTLQIIHHIGSGVDTSRQAQAHVHSAILSPDEKYVLTADLGNDSINVYPFKKQESPIGYETLEHQKGILLEKGSGPRHMVFHPNGKLLYVIQELTSKITVLTYQNGKLKVKQTVLMEPASFFGKIGAADIHISMDGKFLYGSDRGDANVIVIFSILQNGELRYIARQPTLGRTPRNFTLDPTGNFLLVGNQQSDEIVIFKRNKSTGLLTPLHNRIHIGSPVCLKFD